MSLDVMLWCQSSSAVIILNIFPASLNTFEMSLLYTKHNSICPSGFDHGTGVPIFLF